MDKYLIYLKELRYLIGADLKKIPLMTIAFLLSSALDLIGIGLVAPYVSMIISPESYSSGHIKSILLNYGYDLDLKDAMLLIGGALVVIFALKGIAAFLINKMILKFSYNKGVRLRSYLMSAYQNLSYVEYLKRNSSEYVYSILNLTSIFAQNTLQSVLRMISEGLVMFFILCLLMWESGLELGGFIVLITLIMFGYDLVFRRRLVGYGKSVDVNAGNMVQGINEAVEGLKEIRILRKESYFHDKVKKSAQGLSDASTDSAIIKAMPRFLIEFTVVLFIVSLVYVSIFLDRDIVELASTLGIFAVATMRLIPSTNHMLTALTSVSHSRNAVRSLYKDLKSVENNERLNLVDLNNKKNFNCINLDNVSYSYDKAKARALEEISLEINKGESIGLMGASGSGKSTLVDLLLGLLNPDMGSVKFNGDTLDKMNIKDWVSQVAYLPQQIFIIDDTLKNNVALGTPVELIDEKKVMDALEKSNLLEFVNELPAGIETRLGERGAQLSGGQRQRVAIARAFYYERDVLIMDEATSALDNNTEREIVEEIRRLRGKKTLVVVAHRLSTLKYCDRIYKLDKGKIVEVGSYDSVIGEGSTV